MSKKSGLSHILQMFLVAASLTGVIFFSFANAQTPAFEKRLLAARAFIFAKSVEKSVM